MTWPVAVPGRARRPLQRLVEVAHLEQHEPAELLLGLHERTVGDLAAVRAHADRRRRARALEALAGDQHARRARGLAELAPRAERLRDLLRRRVEVGHLLAVERQQHLHVEHLQVACRAGDERPRRFSTAPTRQLRAPCRASRAAPPPAGRARGHPRCRCTARRTGGRARARPRPGRTRSSARRGGRPARPGSARTRPRRTRGRARPAALSSQPCTYSSTVMSGRISEKTIRPSASKASTSSPAAISAARSRAPAALQRAVVEPAVALGAERVEGRERGRDLAVARQQHRDVRAGTEGEGVHGPGPYAETSDPGLGLSARANGAPWP